MVYVAMEMRENSIIQDLVAVDVIKFLQLK